MTSDALSSRTKFLLIAGFLLTGSINTLTKKFQLVTCSSTFDVGDKQGNCPANEKPFAKPWTQNLQMFTGESMMMALFLYSTRTVRARDLPLQGMTPADPAVQTRPPFYIFILPALCDVLGTGIGGIGMLYISAAVWQMMRGSMIIFTSILSVVFLKRKLFLYNWVAVGISATGLILVGVSAIMDGGGAASGNVPLGLMFTIIAQMFAATQMVLEELFVKGYGASPPQVVGSEGVCGILIMVVVLAVMYLIPGNDAGSYENVVDSLHMLGSSGILLFWVLLYLISISCFNYLGVTIAGKLSAVHRTINDAVRTAIVWAVQTVLFYAGSTTYGAKLTEHSWMQVLGFVFLILGSLANHQVIRFPGLKYPMEEASQISMASPSHTHGQLLSPPSKGAEVSKATGP